jgi:hypothetical protein
MPWFEKSFRFSPSFRKQSGFWKYCCKESPKRSTSCLPLRSLRNFRRYSTPSAFRRASRSMSRTHSHDRSVKFRTRRGASRDFSSVLQPSNSNRQANLKSENVFQSPFHVGSLGLMWSLDPLEAAITNHPDFNRIPKAGSIRLRCQCWFH